MNDDMNDAGEMDIPMESIPHDTALTDEYLQSPHSIASLAAEAEGTMTDALFTPPKFAALSAQQMRNGEDEYRLVKVPPNRITSLKNDWMEIYTPIVEYMKLNIRYNPPKKTIELKTCHLTENHQAIQKAADFCKAYCLGFELRDAIALLRLDDLYIDTFEFKDVKIWHGEHLSRAIGRVAGHNGKTKYTIENATKTRIVLAGSSVHILGSYRNINVAKDAIVRLIIGSPPGKIYNQMSNFANKSKSRF